MRQFLEKNKQFWSKRVTFSQTSWLVGCRDLLKQLMPCIISTHQGQCNGFSTWTKWFVGWDPTDTIAEGPLSPSQKLHKELGDERAYANEFCLSPFMFLLQTCVCAAQRNEIAVMAPLWGGTGKRYRRQAKMENTPQQGGATEVRGLSNVFLTMPGPQCSTCHLLHIFTL